MAGNFGFHNGIEAIRIKVVKLDGRKDPEYRKFSVDPRLTSFEVLLSILARAFDTLKDFTVSYMVKDDNGIGMYLSLTSDWDLDAAFFGSADPYLRLKLQVRSFDGFNEWDVITPSDVAVVLHSSKPKGSDEKKAKASNANKNKLENEKHQQQTSIKGTFLNQVGKTFNKMQKVLGLNESADAVVKPIKAPLTDIEFHNFLDSQGRVVQPKELRLSIYQGGIEPSLRKVVWKHILNVYPDGMSACQRMSYIRNKMEEYYRLRTQWQDRIKCRIKDVEMDYVTNMVRKDVLRTDRLHKFYAGSDDSKNIVSLFNILTTYALNHPSVSYCQGMSDLASPILVTMKDEAQAYICFCAVLKRLKPNFMLDGAAMTLKFQHLTEALQFYDPVFFNYLKTHDAENLLFCYRWLLLELKREFAFDESLKMLEVLWSSLPPDPPINEVHLFEKEFDVHTFLPTPLCYVKNENAYMKLRTMVKHESRTSLSISQDVQNGPCRVKTIPNGGIDIKSDIISLTDERDDYKKRCNESDAPNRNLCENALSREFTHDEIKSVTDSPENENSCQENANKRDSQDRVDLSEETPTSGQSFHEFSDVGIVSNLSEKRIHDIRWKKNDTRNTINCNGRISFENSFGGFDSICIKLDSTGSESKRYEKTLKKIHSRNRIHFSDNALAGKSVEEVNHVGAKSNSNPFEDEMKCNEESLTTTGTKNYDNCNGKPVTGELFEAFNCVDDNCKTDSLSPEELNGYGNGLQENNVQNNIKCNGETSCVESFEEYNHDDEERNTSSPIEIECHEETPKSNPQNHLNCDGIPEDSFDECNNLDVISNTNSVENEEVYKDRHKEDYSPNANHFSEKTVTEESFNHVDVKSDTDSPAEMKCCENGLKENSFQNCTNCNGNTLDGKSIEKYYHVDARRKNNSYKEMNGYKEVLSINPQNHTICNVMPRDSFERFNHIDTKSNKNSLENGEVYEGRHKEDYSQNRIHFSGKILTGELFNHVDVKSNDSRLEMNGNGVKGNSAQNYINCNGSISHVDSYEKCNHVNPGRKNNSYKEMNGYKETPKSNPQNHIIYNGITRDSFDGFNRFDMRSNTNSLENRREVFEGRKKDCSQNHRHFNEKPRTKKSFNHVDVKSNDDLLEEKKCYGNGLKVNNDQNHINCNGKPSYIEPFEEYNHVDAKMNGCKETPNINPQNHNGITGNSFEEFNHINMKSNNTSLGKNTRIGGSVDRFDFKSNANSAEKMKCNENGLKDYSAQNYIHCNGNTSHIFDKNNYFNAKRKNNLLKEMSCYKEALKCKPQNNIICYRMTRESFDDINRTGMKSNSSSLKNGTEVYAGRCKEDYSRNRICFSKDSRTGGPFDRLDVKSKASSAEEVNGNGVNSAQNYINCNGNPSYLPSLEKYNHVDARRKNNSYKEMNGYEEATRNKSQNNILCNGITQDSSEDFNHIDMKSRAGTDSLENVNEVYEGRLKESRSQNNVHFGEKTLTSESFNRVGVKSNDDSLEKMKCYQNGLKGNSAHRYINCNTKPSYLDSFEAYNYVNSERNTNASKEINCCKETPNGNPQYHLNCNGICRNFSEEFDHFDMKSNINSIGNEKVVYNGRHEEDYSRNHVRSSGKYHTRESFNPVEIKSKADSREEMKCNGNGLQENDNYINCNGKTFFVEAFDDYNHTETGKGSNCCKPKSNVQNFLNCNGITPNSFEGFNRSDMKSNTNSFENKTVYEERPKEECSENHINFSEKSGESFNCVWEVDSHKEELKCHEEGLKENNNYTNFNGKPRDSFEEHNRLDAKSNSTSSENRKKHYRERRKRYDIGYLINFCEKNLTEECLEKLFNHTENKSSGKSPENGKIFQNHFNFRGKVLSKESLKKLMEALNHIDINRSNHLLKHKHRYRKRRYKRDAHSRLGICEATLTKKTVEELNDVDVKDNEDFPRVKCCREVMREEDYQKQIDFCENTLTKESVEEFNRKMSGKMDPVEYVYKTLNHESEGVACNVSCDVNSVRNIHDRKRLNKNIRKFVSSSDQKKSKKYYDPTYSDLYDADCDSDDEPAATNLNKRIIVRNPKDEAKIEKLREIIPKYLPEDNLKTHKRNNSLSSDSGHSEVTTDSPSISPPSSRNNSEGYASADTATSSKESSVELTTTPINTESSNELSFLMYEQRDNLSTESLNGSMKSRSESPSAFSTKSSDTSSTVVSAKCMDASTEQSIEAVETNDDRQFLDSGVVTNEVEILDEEVMKNEVLFSCGVMKHENVVTFDEEMKNELLKSGEVGKHENVYTCKDEIQNEFLTPCEVRKRENVSPCKQEMKNELLPPREVRKHENALTCEEEIENKFLASWEVIKHENVLTCEESKNPLWTSCEVRKHDNFSTCEEGMKNELLPPCEVRKHENALTCEEEIKNKILASCEVRKHENVSTCEKSKTALLTSCKVKNHDNVLPCEEMKNEFFTSYEMRKYDNILTCEEGIKNEFLTSYEVNKHETAVRHVEEPVEESDIAEICDALKNSSVKTDVWLSDATLTNSCEEACEHFENANETKRRYLPPPHEFAGGNPFLMFLCLTLMLQHRDYIMNNGLDNNELSMHFDKMIRKHNVESVLHEARAFFMDYLKSEFWESTNSHEYPSIHC